MSGIDSMTNPPPVPGEPVTEKIVIPSPVPVTDSSRIAANGAGSPGPQLPFDPKSEPEEWPAHGPAKGFRVNWLTAVLVVLLIAGGGIWGGAELQKHDGSSSTSGTSAFASALASRFGAGRGTTGRGTGGTGGASRFGGATGAGAGGSGAAATGTVTEVQGSTLYVTNAAGNLVEVKLSPTTTVTRDAKTTPGDLVPGDTVIVEGTTAKNGTVSASSVSATAEGVTSGLGALFASGG
jgi:Domain of unknown function (DUF5666)